MTLTVVVKTVDIDALLVARAAEVDAQRVPPVGRSVSRGVTNESGRSNRLDESLDVSSGGLDEGGGRGVGGKGDDFVSDVICQDIVVLVESRNLAKNRVVQSVRTKT